MNTNSLQRRVRTLSFGNRKKSKRGQLLSSSSSLDEMAQLHPPHIETAQVTEVLTRVLEQKRFVYKIEIKWTDGTTSTSYRSYSEFFDFQCSLLVEFPVEGGNKGTPRTIPYLPGKKLFKKSTYALALERKPQINEYIAQLLCLPEHLSKSERVLRFFKSNWQEDRLRSEGNDEGANYSVRYLHKKVLDPSHDESSLKYNDSTTWSGSGDEAEEPIVLGI